MKRILRLEDSAQRKLMVESIRAKSEEIQEESLKGAIAANEQEKKERKERTSKIVNAVATTKRASGCRLTSRDKQEDEEQPIRGSGSSRKHTGHCE